MFYDLLSEDFWPFFKFIVGEDGTCGANYEHAPAEGPPIVALIDHVVEYT